MTSACFILGKRKFFPFINHLVRGNQFSEKDKVHEHMQMPLLPRRRAKGDLACCFHTVLQVFELRFLQKICYFDGKEWLIKDGDITDLN